MSNELKEYLKGKPRKREIVMDSYPMVKTINFPENRWEILKARLEKRGSILVMMKDCKPGKYNVGDVVRASWGELLQVASCEKDKKDNSILVKLIPAKEN